MALVVAATQIKNFKG